MTSSFTGVITRTLEASERRVHIEQAETPLVIEPARSASTEFLSELLRTSSTEIAEAISRHGAVLFRGFELSSMKEFEAQVLSIRGMQGMNEIFLSERGRTIETETTFVLHTNTLYKTGGAWDLSTFHTENYFVPDVPQYISFLCQTPSELGGETGLINMARMYDDLPADLQAKLEERVCFTCAHPISQIVERYAVSTEAALAFCERVDLPVVPINGVPHVLIYKPSVIEHPSTGERTLLINFGPLFGPHYATHRALIDAFRADYAGWQWAMHRLLWKSPWLFDLTRPVDATRAAIARLRRKLKPKRPGEVPPEIATAPRLSTMFSKPEIEAIALSMRRNYSSFLWKKGDMLIVDNLKMAHSGMAGRGRRELKAMICNPVPLPRRNGQPGLYKVPRQRAPSDTLGAQLVELSAGSRR